MPGETALIDAPIEEPTQYRPETPRLDSAEEYAALFEQYRNVALSTALLRLRDRDRAEELVQKVSVHCLQKFSQLRDKGAFSKWIRQITARMCINEATRNKMPIGSEDSLSNVEAEAAERPQTIAIRNETVDQVLAVLHSLRPLDRNILTAFYIDGSSIKKIAEDFQVPDGTVKRRLFVGRKRMRKAFEKLHGNPFLGREAI